MRANVPATFQLSAIVFTSASVMGKMCPRLSNGRIAWKPAPGYIHNVK